MQPSGPATRDGPGATPSRGLPQPGLCQVAEKVAVAKPRVSKRVSLGGILLGFDHDPAAITRERAEHGRVIHRAVTWHGVDAFDDAAQEAPILRVRASLYLRAYILGVHMRDAAAVACCEIDRV